MIEFCERASLHFMIYVHQCKQRALLNTINTFTCTVTTGWGNDGVLQGGSPLITPHQTQPTLSQDEVTRKTLKCRLLYEIGRVAA